MNIPVIQLGKLADDGHSAKLEGANSFDSLQFEIVATDTASFKVRAKASFDTDVDFTAPNSATNRWFYVAIKDYSAAGTVVAGSTGITIAANGCYAFSCNCDRVNAACIEIYDHATGEAIITAYPTSLDVE